MRQWKFWEWIAYSTLWIGAIILAADASLKVTSPEFRSAVSPLLENPVWSFLPLFCFTIGTVVLIIYEFSTLGKRIAHPSQTASPIAPTPDPLRTSSADNVTIGLGRVKSPDKPELRLSLFGGNVFIPDAPDVRDRLTGIHLRAMIWNTGAPSVATSWALTVVPQAETPVRGQLTAIADRVRAAGSINSAVIRGADALDVKTRRESISATPVEGDLLFYCEIAKEVVMRPTTRLELAVKDIYGKESVFTQLMGDWLSR